MKSEQRALREWLENRIRFKTWFSANTIHTKDVFDSLCRNNLRGGPVADKVIWRKACEFHDELLRVVRGMQRAGLTDDRIDTALNGFFAAPNLLVCSNDADVVKVLDKKAVGWKSTSEAAE